MKVLMIPSTMLPFPPVKGGAVQNLIKSYIEYNETTGNHQVTVLSAYDSAAYEEAKAYKLCDVDFVRVPQVFFKMRDSNVSFFSRVGFKLIHFYYLKRIVRLIKSKYKEYDKIILDNTPQFATEVYKVFGKRICIHIYNDYLNTETYNIKGILDTCSVVVTVSDYISNSVFKTGLIEQNRVITLHNGVDLDKFGTKKSKERRDNLRQDLGISDDDFVYIFVARLVPEKGIKELIEAFNALNNDKAHLVIVGNKLYSGNITDPFLMELKALAEKNKERIHFTGYISYDELPDYYTMADVGVLPSLYEEPFALAAIEYMASGLAVILSDAGGFPEMAEGNAAIVVKRGSRFVESLTREMNRVYMDPELYAILSKNGFAKSREFSSLNYCEGLEKIISL